MATTRLGYTALAAETGNTTVPAGTNRVAVVFGGLESNAGARPTAASCTLGGKAMTSLNSGTPSVDGADRRSVYAFILLEADFPADGTQTVTVTYTGGTANQGWETTVHYLGGANQSVTPLGVATACAIAAAYLTVTLGPFTISSDAMAVANVIAETSGRTWSESANWTEESEGNGAGSDTSYAAAYRIYTTGTSDTLVFTVSSAAHQAGFAVCIGGVASGGGVIPVGWNSGMSGGMKALSGGMS
jgi:hypothetical protein